MARDAARSWLLILRWEAGVYRFCKRFYRDERGATAIEYGLIVALISVLIITAVTSVGANLRTKFNAVSSAL